jgi:hypothetical protein
MSELQITVYGGAGEIGGNRILLEWDDGGWLLDFGTRFAATGKYFEEFVKPRTAARPLDPSPLPVCLRGSPPAKWVGAHPGECRVRGLRVLLAVESRILALALNHPQASSPRASRVSDEDPGLEDRCAPPGIARSPSGS